MGEWVVGELPFLLLWLPSPPPNFRPRSCAKALSVGDMRHRKEREKPGPWVTGYDPSYTES